MTYDQGTTTTEGQALMTTHTVTFAPEPGGFFVSCSQGCNLGTSAHAVDEAAAASRVRLHELSTGTVHEEDIKSGTPVADVLARVDVAQRGGELVDSDRVARQVMSNQEARQAAGELEALRELAEAVRASLAKFSEGDVLALAVAANDLGGGAVGLPNWQRAALDKALALYGLVPGLPYKADK